MNKLIKKILNEFDNLQWIRDIVNVNLVKSEDWILVNDIDRESITEGHEIQKYLFDLGYDWGTGGDSLKDSCIYTIYHFGGTAGGDNNLYYLNGCRRAIRVADRDIKSGKYMVYYWSDLKPKTITESDGMDWIRDIKDIEPNIPFEDVVEGETYVTKITDWNMFYDMLDTCYGYINVDNISYAKVLDSDELSCLEVYCKNCNHWKGRKLCLKVLFLDANKESVIVLWMPRDLIHLHHI